MRVRSIQREMVMGSPIFFFLIICLSLFACDQKPGNPVSEYGKTMIDSYKRASPAGEAANLDAIEKAIQAYRATHDKYPESLNEVRELLVVPIDLTKYDYNAETGAVSLKKWNP